MRKLYSGAEQCYESARAYDRDTRYREHASPPVRARSTLARSGDDECMLRINETIETADAARLNIGHLRLVDVRFYVESHAYERLRHSATQIGDLHVLPRFESIK